MKKLLSKSLSVILTLTMVSSMTAVAVTDAGALSIQNVGEQNPSDSAGKAFSLDEVYTDYLFPQTDKTSEVSMKALLKRRCLMPMMTVFMLTFISVRLRKMMIQHPVPANQ